ncbi:MAG: DUF2922 domain-containing protein [Clostridia bacterium]|nr:DUF2922 domain-containing protein [Clostridia bacterium]
MTFVNAANQRVTLSVQDPREDLAAQDVETAMNEIIAANVISSAGGDLVAAVSARIISRQVTELIG